MRDAKGDGGVWVGGVRGPEGEAWVKAALARVRGGEMPRHVYRVCAEVSWRYTYRNWNLLSLLVHLFFEDASLSPAPPLFPM